MADAGDLLRIERVDATRVRVSGALGFTEAAAAYGRYGEVSAGTDGPIELEVDGLRHVDSATLAVLLAWAARAARGGRALRLSGVPADLRALARLCDVEPLLGIA